MVAAQWADPLTLGSTLIALLLGALSLGGIIYAVVRKGALENAQTNAASWESNYQAERVKVENLGGELVAERERLTAEISDLRVAFAKQLSAEQFEQRELQHALQAEKLEAEKEATLLRKLRDTTEVLQVTQEVLTELAATKDQTISMMAQLLEQAEERASARDAAIVETQQEIANSQQLIVDRLERLIDRITGQVVDAVTEALQDDTPSGDTG